MYDKILGLLNSMLGGLTQSANNNLNRDPAKGQLKTAKRLYELVKETGNTTLINKVRGMVGGLSKSSNVQSGRDTAKQQMQTVKELIDIVLKLKKGDM